MPSLAINLSTWRMFASRPGCLRLKKLNTPPKSFYLSEPAFSAPDLERAPFAFRDLQVDADQFIQGILFRAFSHLGSPSLGDFFLSRYVLWNPLSPFNEDLSTTVVCYFCVKYCVTRIGDFLSV